MRHARAATGALVALSFAFALLVAPASAAAEETTVSTIPTPTVEASPTAPVPNAPSFVPRTGKAVYIDRKRQRVYFYLDGRQIDSSLCSTSRTLPRRGTYYVYKQRPAGSLGSVRYYWQSVFTVGPHGNNIAFHSIPVNRSGRIIAPVGKPVSHGCVRLPLAKAKWLYRWITRKTPVIVRP
ncbi:MAG TPA: L,D-transpeptidase [Coriobacteriia bacterium]